MNVFKLAMVVNSVMEIDHIDLQYIGIVWFRPFLPFKMLIGVLNAQIL